MTESISALARKHKINRATLSNWRDQGLDLSDDKAIKIRVRGMKGAKPDSEDLAAAKLRRAVADASKAELAVAEAQGLLCEKAGIKAQGETIGLAVRSLLDQAASDLVPRLAGQTSAEISRLLKSRFREILTHLSQITP